MLDVSTVWRSTVPYSDVQLFLRAIKAFQYPKWDSWSQPPALCLSASLEHLRFIGKWKLLRMKRWLHLKWTMESRPERAMRSQNDTFHLPPSNLKQMVTWLCWIFLNSSGMKQSSLNGLVFHSYDGIPWPPFLYSCSVKSSLHLVTSSVHKGMLWGNWATVRDQFTRLSITLNRARDSIPIWDERIPKISLDSHHNSWCDQTYK